MEYERGSFYSQLLSMSQTNSQPNAKHRYVDNKSSPNFGFWVIAMGAKDPEKVCKTNANPGFTLSVKLRVLTVRDSSRDDA